MRADRPIMVFIPSDDPTDKTMRKLESVAFKNEQVCIGSRFFKCVKLLEGDALEDRILKSAGKSVPRIVLIERDFTVSKVLEKRNLSASKMVRAMKGVVKKEYTASFDKVVKAYTKLLNEYDRLEARKTQATDLEKRLKDKPNPSKMRKLERLQKEVAQEEADLKEREAKIFELQLRGDPKPESA